MPLTTVTMKLRNLLFSSLLNFATATTYAQTTVAPAATTANTTNLSVFAGTYTFASGSPINTYSVTVKDGSLYGDGGVGNYKLIKQAKADTYQSTSSYGSIITFLRDAMTKAITGLTIAAQGQEFSATKEK